MKKLAIAAATVATLTACGGGGGGTSSAPAPATPVPVQAAASAPEPTTPAPVQAAEAASAPAPTKHRASAPAPTQHRALQAAAAADRTDGVPPAQAKTLPKCEQCGTVQDVHMEKRKGEGGAVGVVGGALVGGLLGNQVGKGNGKTLATVGAAVAGGFAGNEVQKHVTSKDVWVTKVQMNDGSVRSFEQETEPTWKAGSAVKVGDKGPAPL